MLAKIMKAKIKGSPRSCPSSSHTPQIRMAIAKFLAAVPVF